MQSLEPMTPRIQVAVSLFECAVRAPCSGLAFLLQGVWGQFPAFPVPQRLMWVGGVRSPAWMFW